MKTIKHLPILMMLAVVIYACSKEKSTEKTKRYTVTFNTDGGTTIESQIVKAGKTVTAPPANPSKKDYLFLFWHLSDAATAYNFQEPVNSNITLIAKWEKENDGYPFYYYFEKKIYLKELKDKIFIEFAKGAGKELMCALIEDSGLQPIIPINWEYYDPNYTWYLDLETKDGSPVSSKIIESFKKKPVVVVVSHLYISLEYDEEWWGWAIAILNNFSVKLLETTSYAQLQELAKKHNCTVGEEFPYDFLKNTFKVYVPKTSLLNAMQLANLFYETGLFEHSSPGWILFQRYW